MKKTYFFSVLLLSLMVYATAQTKSELPKYFMLSEKDLYSSEDGAFCTMHDIKQLFNHGHLKNDNLEWLLDSVIRYDFRSAPDSILQSKSTNNYDAHGNRTLLVTYNWDIENEVWVKYLKDESEYDAQGNVTLSVRYNWDSENEVWVGNLKYEYEYDAHGNQALTEEYLWDDVLNDWIIQYKTFRYFSEFIVGIPFTQDNQVIIYPNPAQDFLYIKGMENADIEIFDISGRLILSRSNANAIDVSGLSTGVYVIKVTDSHNSTIQRFIKQ